MATLFIRDPGSRRYRPAQEPEILSTAADLLGRRLVGEPLTTPRDAGEFLRTRIGKLDYEVFSCLFLDNRHRVLAFEELFRGTINGTAVYPREVVRAALTRNAAAVIFAHNHPSGCAEPSRADEVLTQRLKEALALVEVRVLDHLVIGDNVTSFADRGLL